MKNIKLDLARAIQKISSKLNMSSISKGLILMYSLNSLSFGPTQNQIEEKIAKEKKERIENTKTLEEYLGVKEYNEYISIERFNKIINEPKNINIKHEINTKKMPVFMFHRTGYSGQRYELSPIELKTIFSNLYNNNYYAITFKEYVTGNLRNVPIGKKPYLITFDDAHKSQFKYIKGTKIIDPNSAIAIMDSFFKTHENSGKGAVFFQSAYGIHKEFLYFFGDEETAKEKHDYLIDNGYWIASHTTTHVDLRKISLKKTKEEILTIDALLEKETTINYEKTAENFGMRSLARPYGAVEKNKKIEEFLNKKYDMIMNAIGGRDYLPKSENFDRYHIKRIEADLGTIMKTIKNSSEQFIQTKETKEFFEKVYNYNPKIDIRIENMAYKPIEIQKINYLKQKKTNKHSNQRNY
ncbi:hypothetical protein K9L67_01865 [Candidatus Woesearchaeota archaeon]|nr:hypothetical protein [Candidatus Woesearchaeota archaeon]MCF7900951.1 hypothetical protein [Candidatus Woesearchaeota archaeon]